MLLLVAPRTRIWLFLGPRQRRRRWCDLMREELIGLVGCLSPATAGGCPEPLYPGVTRVALHSNGARGTHKERFTEAVDRWRPPSELPGGPILARPHPHAR